MSPSAISKHHTGPSSIAARLFTALTLTLFLAGLLTTASAASAVGSKVVLLKPYTSGIIPTIDHIRAKNNGDALSDGDGDDPRIQFLAEDAGNGMVHFRTIFGTYLTAENGGGSGVHADATTPGDWETFEIEFGAFGNPDRIRTFDGSRLCAKSNGGLNAKASSCQAGDYPNTNYFWVHFVEDPVHFDDVSSRNEINPGQWEIEGDLRIPTPEGDIILADADVTVTYDGSIAEGIESFTGTAKMPSLPSGSGCGLWCSIRLGYDLTTTATTIQVGYARPSEMPNPFELPLNASTHYLYLLLESGHGVGWGSHEISSPTDGALQVVIDHEAPTVFFYTDFPYGFGTLTGPLESIGYGVSRGNEIRYEPLHTTGVSQWMNGFDSELYLGGEINFALIDGLDITLESDIFMDVESEEYVFGGEFLKRAGYNGVMTYGAEIGPFSLEFDLGSASMRYEMLSSESHWAAISGVIEPEDAFAGIPFRMKGGATFYGYFDDDFNNGEPIFFHLDGELDLGSAFSQQTIEGSVEISENGTSFDGTAKFNGTTIQVEGDVTASRIFFEGSVSHSWNITAGKIKAGVDASFDSRDNGVDLEVSLQFCEDEVFGTCGSINGSVSVNGSGEIRVCATVPEVGERCDSL